jgi:hypothetical protein
MSQSPSEAASSRKLIDRLHDKPDETRRRPLAFGELCSVSELTNIKAMVKCPFSRLHLANLNLQENDAIEKR